MILYILFTALTYLGIQSKLRLNLFSLLAALIPGLRNYSGKDTLLYMNRLQVIQEDQIVWDYEPVLSLIFYLSTVFTKSLTTSWFIANFAYTLIVITVYNFICQKFKKNRERQTTIFINIFFTIIIIDSAFNGMRVGLMIPFALSFLMTEKFTLMLLAILSHISGLFLTSLGIIKRYKIPLFIFIIIGFTFLNEIQGLIELNERINSKYIRYTETNNVSKYSGLIDLIVGFLLFTSSNIKPYIRSILLIVIVPFILLHILKLSEFYGIFRLYRLIIILGIYTIFRKGVVNMKLLAISCLVFALNFIKQFIFTYGDEGGFLPFK